MVLIVVHDLALSKRRHYALVFRVQAAVASRDRAGEPRLPARASSGRSWYSPGARLARISKLDFESVAVLQGFMTLYYENMPCVSMLMFAWLCSYLRDKSMFFKFKQQVDRVDCCSTFKRTIRWETYIANPRHKYIERCKSLYNHLLRTEIERV